MAQSYIFSVQLLSINEDCAVTWLLLFITDKIGIKMPISFQLVLQRGPIMLAGDN